MSKERNKKTKKPAAKKNTAKKAVKHSKVKKSTAKKKVFKVIKKAAAKKPLGKKIIIEPETVIGASLNLHQTENDFEQAVKLEAIRQRLAEITPEPETEIIPTITPVAINEEPATLDDQLLPLDTEINDNIQADILNEEDLTNNVASNARKTIFMYVVIGVLMIAIVFVWFRTTMASIYSSIKSTDALSGVGIETDELAPIDQAIKDMQQELPAVKDMTSSQINNVLNNQNINQPADQQIKDQATDALINKLQNLQPNTNQAN
jgi:hypothetical protein